MQSREKALKRLLELAETMLIGSASETYRTCGNPGCRCHGKGPKHGPHLHVNYKGEHGRTTGYYVPVALQEQVRQGLQAWAEFHELAKEIARQNEELVRARRPNSARSRRQTRQR